MYCVCLSHLQQKGMLESLCESSLVIFLCDVHVIIFPFLVSHFFAAVVHVQRHTYSHVYTHDIYPILHI